MITLSRAELEATAAAYERRFVEPLFRPWALRLIAAAGITPGARVLDIACGTGIVAREAAHRAAPGGRVTGLDINAGMLAVAGRLAPEIDWREGDAEALPFTDAAFDAVLCQFGLMFFADRQAALGEMWRVLASGGRLAVSVFDSLTANRAYSAMADLLERRLGADAALALRFPFSLGDPEALAALAAEAGVPAARIERAEGYARFPGAEATVLADVEGWFPLAGIRPSGSAIEALVAEAERVLAPWSGSDGTVAFPVFAYLLTAAKP